MKKIILILTILCATIINGCGNEIDDIGYVIAIGVDGTEETGYIFTFAIGNPSVAGESRGEAKSGMITYSEAAKDIFTAGEKVERRTGQKMNFSHAELMVMSSDSAQGDMRNVFDSLMRNLKQRPKLIPVVSVISAADTLKAVSPEFEGNPEKYLKKVFESSSFGAFADSHSFAGRMKSGCGIGVPVIETGGDGITVHSIAVFESWEMLGRLKDTISYMLLCGNVREFSYDVGEYGTLFLRQRKKPFVRVTCGECPVIDICVYLESTVASLRESDRGNIQEIAAYRLQSQLVEILENTRDMGCDAFAFFKYGRRNFLTENEWLQYDWNEKYKSAVFNVTVNFTSDKINLIKEAL